jgi:hypothetical protein
LPATRRRALSRFLIARCHQIDTGNPVDTTAPASEAFGAKAHRQEEQ